MATRQNDPMTDDNVDMNKENYKESDYTGKEAKESVKTETNKQTEKAVAATPSTNTLEKTGAPDPENPGVMAQNLDNALGDSTKKDEKNKLEYIQKNNPEYFEEIGMDPDDAFTSLSGVTSDYEEVEEDTTIVDYGGYSYSDTNQNASDSFRPTVILKFDGDFCHPMGKNGCRITSPFGFRILGNPGPWEFHGGVDYDGEIGDPVYAISGGKITKAEFGYNGYGNHIHLEITIKGGKFECVYGHLSKILVKQGDDVVKGQQIGEVGNTGKSTGPHLHFEIRDKSMRPITIPTTSFSAGYKDRKPLPGDAGMTTNAFYGVEKVNGSDDLIIPKTKYFLDPARLGINSA